jgi:hypothetical protein
MDRESQRLFHEKGFVHRLVANGRDLRPARRIGSTRKRDSEETAEPRNAVSMSNQALVFHGGQAASRDLPWEVSIHSCMTFGEEAFRRTCDRGRARD